MCNGRSKGRRWGSPRRAGMGGVHALIVATATSRPLALTRAGPAGKARGVDRGRRRRWTRPWRLPATRLLVAMPTLCRGSLLRTGRAGGPDRAFPHAKDESDTELALLAALRRGHPRDDPGALGGRRFDHALATSACWRSRTWSCAVELLDARTRVHLLRAPAGRSTARLDLPGYEAICLAAPARRAPKRDYIRVFSTRSSTRPCVRDRPAALQRPKRGRGKRLAPPRPSVDCRNQNERRHRATGTEI